MLRLAHTSLRGEEEILVLLSIFLVSYTLAIDVQENIVDEAFFLSLAYIVFRRKCVSPAALSKILLISEEGSVKHMMKIVCFVV